MAGFDYKQYIDNQVIESAPYGLKQAMENVIRQYASTPEGQENLMRAGKTIVRFNPFKTATIGNVIYINPDELRRSQYVGTDGQLHQTSLNRAFAHEMGHAVLKHSDAVKRVSQEDVLRQTYDTFRKPDMPASKDIPAGETYKHLDTLWARGVSAREFWAKHREINREATGIGAAEIQTVRKFENEFMAKYYGEPNRREDVYANSTRGGGTEGLEVYQDILQNRGELKEPDRVTTPTLSGQDGPDRKPKPLIQLKP